MTDILTRAKAHLEAITHGPWTADYEIDGVYAGRKTVVRRQRGEQYEPSRIVTVDQTRRHVSRDGQAEKNVAFIAEAPELVGTLLYAVEEALRLGEHLKKESDRLGCGRGDDLLYAAQRIHTVIEEALTSE